MSPSDVAMPTASCLKTVPKTPEGCNSRLKKSGMEYFFLPLSANGSSQKQMKDPGSIPGSLLYNISAHQIYPSLSTHGTLPAVSATVHCYYTQNTDGKTEAGKESSLAQDLNPGFCTMMPQCQGQTQARTLIWAAQPCTVRLMAIYPHG